MIPSISPFQGRSRKGQRRATRTSSPSHRATSVPFCALAAPPGLVNAKPRHSHSSIASVTFPVKSLVTPSDPMKLLSSKETDPDTRRSDRFSRVTVRRPIGRLEASESPAIRGLKASRDTNSGHSGSASRTRPNG